MGGAGLHRHPAVPDLARRDRGAGRQGDGGRCPTEVPGSMLVLAAGGLGVLLVLFRLVDLPTPDRGDQVDFSRKFGLFLGLLATVGVAYGGWRANEEAPASSTPAAAPPPPAPPPSPGAPA